MFAAAAYVPELMQQFEDDQLARLTPCRSGHIEDVAASLAEVPQSLLRQPDKAERKLFAAMPSSHSYTERHQMIRTLLALIITSNICYVAIITRLRLKHRHRWEFESNQGELFFAARQVVRVVELIATGKQAELRDRFLVVAGYLFIACFLLSLPLMFLYVFS